MVQRLAAFRPSSSASDVAVEAPSTVVVGNERVSVDQIVDNAVEGVAWAKDAMIQSALEGFSHGLVLLGCPRQRVVQPLLLKLGKELLQQNLKLWFTALEVLDEQIIDLLATGPTVSDRREGPPIFVLHPSLGTQRAKSAELPCSDVQELKELLGFVQKRRVLTSSCLHAASSRHHQLYWLRLEGENFCSSLGIFDLRSSPYRSPPADLTLLQTWLVGSLAASSVKQSWLTMALKDVVTGSWHSSLLLDLSASGAAWLKAWAQRPLTASAIKGLPRQQQLEVLQQEVKALKLQKMEKSRSEALAQHSALILEFSKLAPDVKRLRRERQKTFEWCGAVPEETQELLEQDLMTPYMLNLSDDPALAGCLMYLLPKGERSRVGSDPDNTIVLDGLGVLPNLCSIVNVDDTKLTLSRPDFAKANVLVNGKTMARDTLVLAHHDRICLGRAQMFQLHIPRHGVETIQEEEKLGLQHLECLLPEDLAGFLPPLPRQGFEVNFVNLQHLLEHSESLRNLQYYVQDLFPRLTSASSKLACFETLRKACYLVDEANMITREVRPQDQLQFELELVWDIFRHPEEVLLIRLMNYSAAQPTAESSGQVLHYWSFGRFQDRLEVMRDIHRAQCGGRCAVGRGWHGQLLDPWRESNIFPLRHLLNHSLSDRQDKEVEDLKRQLGEMRQELLEKTEQLEKKTEIISQLNEQIMGVVSLTQEIREEVDLQSSALASPQPVPTEPVAHSRRGPETQSEENFSMSVSESTVSDGPQNAALSEVRSRAFKVDKLSNSLIQSLAPALLSQSSLTPPHCYRDLHR